MQLILKLHFRKQDISRPDPILQHHLAVGSVADKISQRILAANCHARLNGYRESGISAYP